MSNVSGPRTSNDTEVARTPAFPAIVQLYGKPRGEPSAAEWGGIRKGGVGDICLIENNPPHPDQQSLELRQTHCVAIERGGQRAEPFIGN